MDPFVLGRTAFLFVARLAPAKGAEMLAVVGFAGWSLRVKTYN